MWFKRRKKVPRWSRWLANTVFLIVAISITALIYQQAIAPGETENHDAFAKCLTENEAVLYANDWCDYCQSQKKAFGESFSHIHYVNCDFNGVLCQEKGIYSYPTWYIGDKKQKSGMLSLNRLGFLTSCEYTEVNE